MDAAIGEVDTQVGQSGDFRCALYVEILRNGRDAVGAQPGNIVLLRDGKEVYRPLQIHRFDLKERKFV